MRKVIILQARLASSRYPEKVLAEISGRPVIALILERLATAGRADAICVAIPKDPGEDKLADALAGLNAHVVRGSGHDVLGRYIQAAYETRADVIVRATADNLFVSAAEIDRHLELLESSPETDYVITEGYPLGVTPETFTLKTLEKLDYLARHDDEREHVTLYLRKNPRPFQVATLKAPEELADAGLKISLDTPRDFKLINRIYEQLYKPGQPVELSAAMELLKNNEELMQIGRLEMAAWARA